MKASIVLLELRIGIGPAVLTTVMKIRCMDYWGFFGWLRNC
jgi:hypothetical protein